MKTSRLGASILFPASLCVLVAGCRGGTSPAGQKEDVPAELQQYVLDAVPKDLPRPTLVDFASKVHLVGFDISPEERVTRGGTVQLKIYWRSVAPLSPGWKLFTHLLDGRGQMIANADEVGPLRQGGAALTPSAWEPGKVYVDEQTLEIPANVKSELVTVVVGIWKYASYETSKGAGQVDMRLGVMSGKTDGQNRAILAHLRTDYTRPKPVAASNEPTP